MVMEMFFMHDILTGQVGECVTNANWYFVTMRNQFPE